MKYSLFKLMVRDTLLHNSLEANDQTHRFYSNSANDFVLFVAGLMLFLVSLIMLYIKRHIRDSDVDDEKDVYLIAREMHHRELALQKKNNVNSIPSIKDRPLLDQIPEHEI